MSFQIDTVCIYSFDSRRRDLKFRQNALNIITGRSETGKSTLVSIINYCLGASTYKIPVATIHNSCSWFGVLFRGNESTLFVARPRLPEGQKTNSSVCILHGLDAPPEPSSVEINSNLDDLVEALSGLAGIEDIQTAPEKGRTTEPIKPNIKHARDLILQPQRVLASDAQLLYGTEEYFERLHLRDCMPYFLGVVGGEFSKERALLRELRHEMKQLELREQQSAARRQRVVSESASLRSAAIDAGMAGLPATTESVDDALSVIQAIGDWEEQSQIATGDDGEEVDRLRALAKSLNDEIQSLKERLDSAEAFAIRASSFAEEGARQDSRVKLVSIFGNTNVGSRCPICNQSVDAEDELIATVRASADRLANQLSSVERQRPQLAKYLEQVRAEVQERGVALARTESSIYSIIRSRQEAKDRELAALQRARIAGRATEILSMLTGEVVATSQDTKRRKLKREISRLEKDYSEEAIAEKMRSAETVISANVSKFAKRMELEQCDTPLVFDLKEFQLRFSVGLQTVTLERIGAQKNWVGYHIAAVLSLQQWFASNNRPVPRFSVFDQVSQPFFANESQLDPERTEENLVDEDRAQVMLLIHQLQLFCQEDAEGVQVILTEHVDSGESWFREAIVEIWRDGNALVPNDWPERP